VIEPRRIPRAVRRARGNRDIVLVDGMSGTVTRMARCCAPLPGDPIVGFITQGRGISVHRADCASLASIQDRSGENGARLVNVEWGDASHSMKKAVVRIVCNDRKGLLSDVTGAMAALNINIVGAHTSSNLRENRAILKLIILIEDSEQLNAVIQRILTVPGVISASRMVQK
jgi:GTP pyrophosphokinase